MEYVCVLGSQKPGLGRPSIGAYTSPPLFRRVSSGTCNAAARQPSKLAQAKGSKPAQAERLTGGFPETALQQRVTLADPRYHKIAEFWDDEKNGDLQLADVLHKSTKPVHLRCNGCPTCGRQHEWTAKPHDLTKRGGNIVCPFCHGSGARGRVCFCRTIASSKTLMAEWSAANELRPELITRKSKQKVMWKCPRGRGHPDYLAMPQNRTVKGQGCPACAGRIHGSVVEDRPELLAEWDEQNEKTPYEISCGSDYKAQWKCQKCNCKWEAAVRSRAMKGTGCPACAIARRTKSKA